MAKVLYIEACHSDACWVGVAAASHEINTYGEAGWDYVERHGGFPDYVRQLRRLWRSPSK